MKQRATSQIGYRIQRGNFMATNNDCNVSMISGAKSVFSMGGGLVNRFSSALSRVVFNKNNHIDDDEDDC